MSRWRARPLLLTLGAVCLLLSTGCDGAPEVGNATTTVSEPSPSSGTSPTADITLVPYTDSLYGMRTVVPDGWAEDLDAGFVGVLRPPDPTDASTLLAVQFHNATTPAVASSLLADQFRPLGPLEAVGTTTTATLTWELFRSTSEAEVFGGKATDINIALSESSNGLYVVLLATPLGESAGFTEAVFEAAVAALAPPDRPAIDASAPYLDPTMFTEERIEDLLDRMTLLEKIGQMTLVEKDSIIDEDLGALGIGALLSGGGGSPPTNNAEAWADMIDGFQEHALESRLRIPLLYGIDAVHGHNNVKGAVIFPHNIGLGAAGDPELVERIGNITATETAATGIFWNYAPVLAVPQDLRWGRTYEAYGADTEMVADLGAAFVRGFQREDDTRRSISMATPKHYVADGGTAWGSSASFGYAIDQGVARIDEETLRAIHLPPFEAAVEAGAMSIMASFSSWDGLKMHAQKYLLTDVLKGELEFEGLVVSDWAGVDQISDDYPEAVITAVNAGIDMNMVPSRYREFIWILAHSVDAGEVPVERIDDAVRRILRAKFALGLFEEPFAERSLLGSVGSPQHREVAREAVGRSLVLLKNDRATLPITADVGEIFVGGQAADDIGIQSGGWTIEWQGATGDITPGTTVLEGIKAETLDTTLVYHDRFGRLDRVDLPGGRPDPDLCLAVVGERPYAEGHGDRYEPEIVDQDLAVLKNMREGCEQLAVVLIAGRPLLIADLVEDWDALVMAWLPGSEGGGVAEVLFGRRAFTGHLPIAWPRNVNQLPLGTETGEPPLFPHGHGLMGAE